MNKEKLSYCLFLYWILLMVHNITTLVWIPIHFFVVLIFVASEEFISGSKIPKLKNITIKDIFSGFLILVWILFLMIITIVLNWLLLDILKINSKIPFPQIIFAFAIGLLILEYLPIKRKVKASFSKPY